MRLRELNLVLALTVGMLGLKVDPALCISADLAKKCRGLAIKAHPPERGPKAHSAQAEREYFQECVRKNGEMP